LTQPLALVVEDDYDATVIFEEALNAAGFDTEVIESGDEAMKRLDEATPDLVILDLHLPKVAGTSILERLRSSAKLKDTHVIVVTGDTELADKLVQSNAFQILVKPVSFSQLRDLARLLRLSGKSSL